MKPIFLSIVCTTLLGCAQIATPGSPLSQIVDRTISDDTNTFVVASNGSLTGSVNGEAFVGTWREEDGFFCRSGQFGSTIVQDACQSVTVTDGQVTLRHGRGTGPARTYRIN